MELEVFAVLKEYFDKQFVVTEEIENIRSLRKYLAEQNSQAANVLTSCRFAINDEFVNDDYQLNENDRISIIPPSSGG